MDVSPDARVYVAGHRGPIGRALIRRLRDEGFERLLLRSARQLDPCRAEQVDAFFSVQRPEFVVVTPGDPRPEGPPQRLYRDAVGAANILRAAASHAVRKVVLVTAAPSAGATWTFLASLADGFRRHEGVDAVSLTCAIPFGPDDAFDPPEGQALASLFRAAHEARVRGDASVRLSAPGHERHDLLYADDVADGLLFTLQSYMGPGAVHLSGGHDLRWDEWAALVAKTVGYRGRFMFEAEGAAAPGAGAHRSRLATRGWRPRTELPEALARTYAGYLEGGGARATSRPLPRSTGHVPNA